VKLRSMHGGAPARVTGLADGRAEVRLEMPQRAVAPGQACVFYDGSRVLGGGWIEREAA
jgi:tRNA-specific 2-thiouridylase